MGQLLSLLAQAPRREIPLIDLILSISSPTEHCIPWDSYVESEENQVLLGKVRKKYLELSEGWDIGIHALSEISYFKISLDSRALLFAPATINLMASRMARLRKVEWTLDDAEKLDPNIRIAQRTAFARTLTSLPSSIEEFRLEYIREPPRDRTFRPASILPPDARGDILSQELRQLSQRLGLREFLVQASVDTTILWPSSQDMECKPTWPTLELLRVEINDVLPSGEWVEIRDPEDSNDELAEDTDEDERLEIEVPGEERGRRFNPIFNPVHFDQFALAVARAASQMPKIEEMYLAYQGYAPMSIGFVTRDCFTWERKRKPHLEFCGDTASIMHPSTETMEAWRGTKAQHNLEWNVHFADNGSQYHIGDF
ncbi:atp-dependent dna helicase [Fusarium mexicanum]|uniref:Atp-dependent dna helicase n=1 Tax=Fusarium mexicanum TaxID=751941 RepID=A0A8H5IJB7_9HYPO|nr:atp-dependent dna helicase [Fusarium mexicanum]